VEQPTSNTTEPWIITVDGPGWLASVSGHTGFHGVNPYVDVGFGSIIRHVDAIYATEAEIGRDDSAPCPSGGRKQPLLALDCRRKLTGALTARSKLHPTG
jgi:hypothetical protein